jgi:hypothetical protein
VSHAFITRHDPVVTLEMTESEAEIVRALLGGVISDSSSDVGASVVGIFETLTEAGVGADSIETFSDLFVGEVRVRPLMESVLR